MVEKKERENRPSKILHRAELLGAYLVPDQHGLLLVGRAASQVPLNSTLVQFTSLKQENDRV